MPRPHLFLLVLCAAVAVGGPPAARAAQSAQPNILLVVIDALRRDHLGAYGYDRPTSPFLDHLAAEGTLFSRAYSVTSYTPPAIASLLTGAPPQALGSDEASYISSGTPTLAAVLQKGGYATGGFTANPHVSVRRGFAAGFQTFHRGKYRGYLTPRRAKFRADRVNTLAAEWLRQQSPDRPWFLYVHYMEAHAPYAPGDEKAERFWRHREIDFHQPMQELGKKLFRWVRTPGLAVSAREREYLVDLYDAEIAEADAGVAALVGQIPAAGKRKTVICVVADHGEEFRDHGGFLHAFTLFEEEIHIPLILRADDERLPRGRVDRVVQISDVAPTLVDLAGLTIPPGFRGLSLLHPGEPSPVIVTELGTRRRRHRASVTRGGQKLVVGMGKDEMLLFDLERDAAEQHDLAAEHPAVARQLLDELERRQPRALQQAASPKPTAVLDERTREQLRALGYE